MNIHENSKQIEINNQIENKVEASVDAESSSYKRETWTGRFDFFLTALGYAVGLGAIWRFPYLCYRNGGGAFLVPYFIFLALVGIPLVFLEMCVGQFTSSGPMTCWVMSPLFRGIGFSVNIVNNYVNIYFTMILAYSLYFLFLSFNSVLPWENCNPEWSQINCVDNFDAAKSNNLTLCDDAMYDLKCNDGLCYYSLIAPGINATCGRNNSHLISKGIWNPSYPSQIYWSKKILQKTSGIDETGHIVWQLILGLFIAWVIITAMVIKGIRVSGKLVYFTALFPYVVLLILGIRGWMLEGAANGIFYYIYPDFSKLNNLRVWSDAAAQIFFTLSVSYGGLSALASYNEFNTNILRDAIAVSLGNCGTSIFAGFVVFSYIGYLAHITGQDIDKVVQAGQGLAFVVYPFAVTTIKGAPFWSILFFLMMLILGLDSTMGSVETFITSIFDIFPKLREKSWRRYSSILLINITFFVCGIIFTFQSGTYWIELFDTFSGNWAIFIIAFLEVTAVAWFYGFNRFRNDIAAMLGVNIAHHFLFNIFRILWCFITPLIVVGLFIVAVINVKGLENEGREYPYWTLVAGNFISASSLLGVVIWPVYLIVDALFINKRPLRTLLEPDKTWRPLKEENRMRVDLAHNFNNPQNDSFQVAAVHNETFEFNEKF